MSAQILLSISIALFAGLMLSRLAKLLKLPAVTAYLVAGILVGPYVLGLFDVPGLGFTSMENVESFKILCEIALGFIAFSIGNEFRLSQLKKIGKQATIIGILQAVVTTLLVDAALIGFSLLRPDVLSLSAALTLGAIAAATAPAATLMVVKQYKAKGPLTDILLPVVALDDAVGLILFAASLGVAKAIQPGNVVSVISMLVEPILEIVLSIALGAAMGFIFNFCERFFHSRSKRLSMSITFVFLTIGLSMLKFTLFDTVHVGFSSLLTCMMLGTVFCNVCDFSEELMERVDRWTAPLFIIFFVLSGAELELSVFTNIMIVLIGIVYILSRSVGKYSGAYLSAKLAKCDDNIVKYLGVTLLPQAGVALGMSLIAKETLGADGEIIRSITLFAVLIYELIGPMLTKISLIKAGDIQVEGKTSARDDHIKTLPEHKQSKHKFKLGK